MKKSELRKMIREEIQSLNEKKVPKKGTPDYQQHKIAVDTVKNPLKGTFLGGPTATEAEKTLKTKFGYTQSDIDRLKNN